MGKFKMGSGSSKASLTAPVSTLTSGLPVQYDDSELKASIESILVEHQSLFAALAKAEAKPLATMPAESFETRVVETIREVSKPDHWARKHSKMVSDRTEALAKSVQKLESEVHKPNEMISWVESLENKIACLEMLKPQEKHIVTKETVVRTVIPKIVYIGLALSFALNILVLILK